MRLTGKAKEQFEEWFNTHHVYEHSGLAKFEYLPESMQWGVYQDWADSIDIWIEVYPIGNNLFCWSISNYGNTKTTRQEARNAAIDKLNEIVNEK